MGVLYDKTLTIINVGDSRAVKINADRTQVKQLSTDHKPQIKIEQERIKMQGFVHNGYVYNKLGYGLAISRLLEIYPLMIMKLLRVNLRLKYTLLVQEIHFFFARMVLGCCFKRASTRVC